MTVIIRVTLKSDRLDHISTSRDGNARALCGRSPWPQHWEHGGNGKVLCQSCRNRFRTWHVMAEGKGTDA